MKSFIREKRKLIIERKIITPTIIREFASIIGGELNQLDGKNYEPCAVFSIDANDNSSYESQSPEIFREGDILDKKGAVKVNMRFNTRDFSKNIEIQLVHITDLEKETTRTENFILVSGDDPTWVNGILARYNEIISLTEDQTDYKRFANGSVLLILTLLNIIYFRLFYSKIDAVKPGWVSVLLTLGPPLLCLFYAEKLTNHVSSIWPDMEFQTGPGHLQIPSLKRRKLIWIVVTFLIPIFIGIVYDLVKSVF